MWRYAWFLFLQQYLCSFNKAIHCGVVFFFTHHISSSKNSAIGDYCTISTSTCIVIRLLYVMFIACVSRYTVVYHVQILKHQWFFFALCSSERFSGIHYYSLLLDQVIPSCIVAFRSYVVTVCAVSTTWLFSLYHSVSSCMWDIGSFPMLVWTRVRNFCSYTVFGVVLKISAHTLILWKCSHCLLLNWEWDLLYHE